MKSFTIGSVGPRIVLVHGNDLCGEFYAPLAQQLAARDVRTTLLTLPGFHGEPPLPAPSWAALVDALLQFIQPHDPPLVLAGHSMGGLIALLAAARRPTWLHGLALLEPAVFPGKLVANVAARRYLRQVVHAEDRDAFKNWNGGMRRIADMAAYPQAAIDLYLQVRRTSDRSTGAALFTSLPALDPLPYESVAVPALLVTGAATGIFGRAISGLLRRRLGAEAVVVPGAAHWLVHEADAAVADAVAAFVHGAARSHASTCSPM